MIILNGNQYKLCLIDTNVVSELVKQPNPVFRRFLEKINPSKYIHCFSLFTIMELRKNPIIYNLFLEIYSLYPCIILKSLDQLFQNEIDAYPYPNGITPVLTTSLGAFAKKDLKLFELLDQVFSMPDVQRNEFKWNSEKLSIIEGILSLKQNYPPKGPKYTKKEIQTFIQLAGFQQIALRAPSFAKAAVKHGNPVIIDAFPSIKITAYIVFFKFYPDQRKPLISDTFDIIISSAIPYVDAVTTEKHMADSYKKTKQYDNFIDNLEIFTLKDFL